MISMCLLIVPPATCGEKRHRGLVRSTLYLHYTLLHCIQCGRRVCPPPYPPPTGPEKLLKVSRPVRTTIFLGSFERLNFETSKNRFCIGLASNLVQHAFRVGCECQQHSKPSTATKHCKYWIGKHMRYMCISLHMHQKYSFSALFALFFSTSLGRRLPTGSKTPLGHDFFRK